MRFSTAFSFPFLFLPIQLCAQLTELEPNESTAQATIWTYGQSMSGSECSPPSFDTDYFLIVLPSDGVISFTVTTQGSGPDPGNLQFALFPKSGFYQQYHTLSGALEPTTQTFSHTCLSGDTMFVRVQEDNVGANSCISYEMSFSVTPAAFPNDTGANDDFANPQPVDLGTTVEGHLDFLYDASADHYGLTLPDDGTLRIIAEASQADTVSTSTIEVYIDQTNTYHYIQVGASGISEPDTFLTSCVRAGDLTVRLQTGTVEGCGFAYRLHFELVPPVFGNDTEPNDDEQTATIVTADTDQDGHIAYIGTSAFDHFKLWKPFAGSMRVIFSSSTAGASPALNVWTLNANVNENITTGENGEVAYDTVYVTTADPDTIVLRVSAVNFGYCGSYRFRYESDPVGIDDRAMDPFTVWPNPSADGLFRVHAAFVPTWMEVRDVQGRMLAVDRTVIGHEWNLDLSQEPAGVYALRVGDASGNTATTRIVLR